MEALAAVCLSTDCTYLSPLTVSRSEQLRVLFRLHIWAPIYLSLCMMLLPLSGPRVMSASHLQGWGYGAFKSHLYRKDAYETSLLIVTECQSVFDEIQAIVKKSSKDGEYVDGKVSVDRIGKIMWMFRKSRVQLLRGNLESLKSTILVELAVLNYAEKISSPERYLHLPRVQYSTVKSCQVRNKST